MTGTNRTLSAARRIGRHTMPALACAAVVEFVSALTACGPPNATTPPAPVAPLPVAQGDGGLDGGGACAGSPPPRRGQAFASFSRPPADDDVLAPDGLPPRPCSGDSSCEAGEVCVAANLLTGGRGTRCVAAAQFPAGEHWADVCVALCEGRCRYAQSAACGAVGCPRACDERMRCGGDGRCAPDPQPYFEVSVVMEVTPCDLNQDLCQGGEGLFCRRSLPDPYVRVPGSVRQGDHMTEPLPNRCAGCRRLGTLAEGVLLDGLLLSVLDDDSPASDDVLCPEARVVFSPEEIAEGHKSHACAGRVGVSLEFTLTPAP